MQNTPTRSQNPKSLAGIVLMVSAVVIFICSTIIVMFMIYGMAGSESSGQSKAQLSQQLDVATSLLNLAKIVSPILFLSGVGFLVYAHFEKRRTL